MADFTKKYVKNVRYSVNRNKHIYVYISEDERGVYRSLVKVLQERRNTGTAVDTFLYLVKKHKKQAPVVPGLKVNDKYSVFRNVRVHIKVSETENKMWNEKVAIHGGSIVECFMDMINAEYTFQDKLEVIIEK